MRKFYIILAGILFTFLFTTCKQFTADIEEDLSYWASEAFITGDTILSGYKTDTNSTRCVASKDGAAVTLTVRNPKAFSFDIPSITASSLIHFNGLAAQPQHGADYTLRQTGPNTLKLTYTQAFLEKNEQGTADLGPTIALKASDGRVFNKAYTFSIKSNSPPPKPKEIVIAKTTETPPHYVLCFQFDTTEMTRTMGTGTVPPVHKDISNITINGTSYTLLYKDDNSDFQKPAETPPIGSFIEHGDVASLTTTVPSGAWVLYYKTNVEVKPGNPRSEYAVTLQDAGSLTSATATAVIEATAPEYTVTYSVVGAVGGTIQAGSDPATTSSSTKQVVEGGSVTFTADPDTGYEVDSWTVSPASSFASGGTTGAANARLDNITENKTVTVKFKKKVYSVTFNVVGGHGTISARPQGGSESSTGSVSVEHGTQVIFTAHPDPGYEVDSWSSNVTPQSPNTTATLTVTAPVTVTVTFRQKTYTVNYSVVGSVGGTINADSDTPTTSSSTKQVVEGGSVTFTASPATGWEVDSWTLDGSSVNGTNPTYTLSGVTGNKNVTVKFKKKVYTVTFNVVGGTGCSLTANYGSHPYPSTTTSSSVQVTHGDSVTFTAHPHNGWEVDSWSSNVTPQSPNTTATLTVTAPVTVTVKFKKKVYTVTFSVADGEGTLQGTYGSQTPTTQNGGGTATLTNVPHGASVSFTATPNDGWELDGWTGVSSSSLNATLSNVTGDKTVTVKFKPGVFNLTGPDAWKKLKEEANKPRGAHTILINGEITATGGDNAGEIKLGRNLTIRGGSSAVLNANGKSHVFDVKNGKTLILEDITLKNGQAQDGKPGGGAAVWGGCTLIMQGSSTITNCKASYGGGVYIDNGGTLIMKDSSTITNCEADDGGGVYVDGTFKMEGGAIVTPSTGSDKNEKGKNDVDLENGKTVTVTGALSHTPAARITPYSYTDGRVLATGAAEKANFKVTPKNGTEYWRYNKVGNEIKFVKAELRITFTKIKCVEVKDGSSEAEYYWTIKVGKDTIDEKKSNQKYMWDAQNKAERSINKFFKRDTNPFPVASIPVNIEIWEYDRTDPDDHIGTTKAHLTYDYDNDQWEWEYDGNWISGPASELHGNQKKNSSKTIGDGGEEIFTEQYRHTEGDTDVTIKISWKE